MTESHCRMRFRNLSLAVVALCVLLGDDKSAPAQFTTHPKQAQNQAAIAGKPVKLHFQEYAQHAGFSASGEEFYLLNLKGTVYVWKRTTGELISR